jgi:hypothetical protein
MCHTRCYSLGLFLLPLAFIIIMMCVHSAWPPSANPRRRRNADNNFLRHIHILVA